MTLGELIESDMKIAGYKRRGLFWRVLYLLLYPPHLATCFYRLAFYFTAKGKGWQQVGRLFWRLNMFLTSCDIHAEAEIGPGLFMPHPTGIVIGQCKIGKNASILQNVTVGSLRKRIIVTPVIGDDVEIWAGAVVAGEITIGDRVAIGANAVVLENVPSDSLAVGVPAHFKPRAKRG